MANEPIIVLGTLNNGSVIPIAIPSSDRACSCVYPLLVSIIGIMIEIKGIINEEITLTTVIGVLFLINVLNFGFEKEKPPPTFLYIIIPITVLIIPAITIPITGAYIEEKFLTENISCEHLAELCGISYSYFQRIFSQKYGISPKRYIIQLKVNYASDLLKSGEYSVSQTAEMSGFDDLYFFSRQFKEYVGMSPQKYKNNPPK